jgi:hypothetical protein
MRDHSPRLPAAGYEPGRVLPERPTHEDVSGPNAGRQRVGERASVDLAGRAGLGRIALQDGERALDRGAGTTDDVAQLAVPVRPPEPPEPRGLQLRGRIVVDGRERDRFVADGGDPNVGVQGERRAPFRAVERACVDLLREVPPTARVGDRDQKDEPRQESSGHRLRVASAIVDDGAYEARRRAPGSTIRLPTSLLAMGPAGSSEPNRLGGR